MVTDGKHSSNGVKKYHYIALKKLSALLRGIKIEIKIEI